MEYKINRYYWVLRDNDGDWEIAMFLCKDTWQVIGDENLWSTKDFFEIGDEVQK